VGFRGFRGITYIMPWDFLWWCFCVYGLVSWGGGQLLGWCVACVSRLSVFWEISLGMAVLIALVFGFPVSIHILVLVVYCQVFCVCVSYYVSGCLVWGGYDLARGD
jgi:hypothetical protein